MNPLRVSMLIQAYLPHVGGAERQLAALVPRLRARDVQPTILTRARDDAPSTETRDGASIHRIAAPGPKALASAAYTAGTVLHLMRGRPDVIHAHELLSPATSALAAGTALRVPVVAKVLAGGDGGDIDKLRRTRHGRLRLSAIVRRVDAFAVISREIDSELAAVGVPTERRHFIPNGVDAERFDPPTQDEWRELRARHGLTDEDLVAVYVGRLTAQKGVENLLEAWRGIASDGTRRRLWIVGDGPDRPTLERRAPAGVTFVGSVDDVAPLLKAADLFVLPSRAEGLSNALLEAMATARPVVATRVGGAPDLLRDVPGAEPPDPDDPGALARSMRRYFEDPALRAAAGRMLHARVHADYSIETTADRLAHLYDDLARSPKDRL